MIGYIKSNRYRVHSIFTRLDDAQDKEDLLFILKQLAAEGLLLPEQFGQLSELEQMDLPTIALVIYDTKVGQGLKFRPRKLTDLKQQLQIWLKDLVEVGHSATRKQVAAVLEKLLKRNGSSLERYTNIKGDMHFLSLAGTREWSREFDRNIELVSGMVSDGTSSFWLCGTLDGKINPPYLQHQWKEDVFVIL